MNIEVVENDLRTMTVQELSQLIVWLGEQSAGTSSNSAKAELALLSLDCILRDASQLMRDVGKEVYP